MTSRSLVPVTPSALERMSDAARVPIEVDGPNLRAYLTLGDTVFVAELHEAEGEVAS